MHCYEQVLSSGQRELKKSVVVIQTTRTVQESWPSGDTSTSVLLNAITTQLDLVVLLSQRNRQK